MALILHCHLMAITGIKSLLKFEGQDTVRQKAVKCSTSKWQGMVKKTSFYKWPKFTKGQGLAEKNVSLISAFIWKVLPLIYID